MAEWNKSKVLPSAINGGQEFTTKDNLAINELNAIVNNSFYASEISETSIAKADSAVATSKLAEDKIDNFIKTEGNSVVTLNGVPQVTWSADFAESERQKSKNLFNVNNGFLHGGLNNGSVANTDMLSFSISNGVLSLTVTASWRGVHSDYFSLKENTIYTFAKQSGDTAYCIIEMYDASKTYLGNVDVQFNDILTFTTVSGTAYARISFSNTVVGTVEISEIYLAEESSFSGYTKYSGAVCHKGDAEIQFAETEKEKSKNLLPVMSTAEVITIGENGLITFNGNVGAWRYDIFIGEVYLKKGKTYTLSIHNYSGSGKQLLLFRAKKISDGTEIREYLYTYGTEGRVTPTEDVILISGGFYFANEMTVNFSCFVQIEEGDVVTDYQPYNGAIVHEKDIERVKTLYDMSSFDTNKNWGDTSGIPLYDSLNIVHDFSGFKKYDFIYEPCSHGENWYASARTITIQDIVVGDGLYTYYDCVMPSDAYASNLNGRQIYTQFRMASNKQSVAVISYIINADGSFSQITSGYNDFYRLIKIVGYK